MNNRQAVRDFKKNILPAVSRHYERDGTRDWPARREAWSNYVDGLARGGHITEKQAADWDQPACCKRGGEE